MTLWQRYQIWRHRPGMLLAAKLAEQQAWKHPNAGLMGAEQNLMVFCRSLYTRVVEADQHGDISGYCLDATTPLAKLKRRSQTLSPHKRPTEGTRR